MNSKTYRLAIIQLLSLTKLTNLSNNLFNNTIISKQEQYHLMNTWIIQTNLEIPESSKAISSIIQWEEVVATKFLQALQEPKPVKQGDNNERKKEGDRDNLVA